MPVAFHFVWIIGMLFFFVLCVAIVVGIVAFATRHPAPVAASSPPVPATPPPSKGETPLDILARRFASGEITAEEYQKGRDLLSS